VIDIIPLALRQSTDDARGFIPGPTITTTTTNTSTNPTPSTTHLRRPTVGEFILGRGLDGDAVCDDTEPTPLHQMFIASFNYSREPGQGEPTTLPLPLPSVSARFRLMPRASSQGSPKKEKDSRKDSSGSSDGGNPRRSSSGMTMTPRDSDPAAARELGTGPRFYVMTNLPPPVG
jgi:hypothetical protein